MGTVTNSDIYAGLLSYLTADSTFNTAMGGDATTAGRVYWQQAPNEPTLPYAVIIPVDAVADDSFATDGIDARVQVTIYDTHRSAGAAVVQSHADKLRARMHRTTYTATGHEPVRTHVLVERGPSREGARYWRIDQDIRLRTFATA